MPTTDTILLVEEDPGRAASAAHILQAAGYQVLPAATAAQALHSLATGAHTPPPPDDSLAGAAPAIDLALVSIHLPAQMDGLQLAQEIRRRCDIPLLFLSTCSDPQIMAQAEQVSPYGCLLQPVKPLEMLSAIRQAFRLHRALGAQKAAEQALQQAGKEYERLLREQRRRISDSLAMAASLLDLSVEQLPDEQARRAPACAPLSPCTIRSTGAAKAAPTRTASTWPPISWT